MKMQNKKNENSLPRLAFKRKNKHNKREIQNQNEIDARLMQIQWNLDAQNHNAIQHSNILADRVPKPSQTIHRANHDLKLQQEPISKAGLGKIECIAQITKTS